MKRTAVKQATMFGAIAIVALLAATAQATTLGTVYISYEQPGAVGIAHASYAPSGGGVLNTGWVYTGAYLFEVDGTQPATGLGQDLPVGTKFGAVCIDVTQRASGQSRLYEIKPLEEAPLTTFPGAGPMGTTRAAMLQNLWHDHFDLDWIGPGPYSAAMKNEAEAFSAAVWELVFEEDGNPLNILNGALTVSSVDNAALANSWLAGLDPDGELTNLYALSNASYQDYVVMIPLSDKDQLIPEPVTMAGLLLGVSSVGAYVRRRRRA